jgi:hypothetical protein
MKYGWALILLVTTSCVTAPSEKSAAPSKKLLQLEDVLKEKATDSKSVLKYLKKCVDECRAPDQEIAKGLAEGYEILFAVADKNPIYSNLTKEQQDQAIVGQQKVRNAFLKVLEVKEGRDLLMTAYRELASSQSLFAGLDTELDIAMNALFDRLQKKPETLATAWYLRAMSIPPMADNVLEIIGAYRNCLKANSKDDQCLAAYKDVVLFYERPRCKEPEFQSDIRFVDGADKTHLKKEILNTNDLLEASLELISDNHWEVWFSLKTFSVEKLAEYTEFSIKELKNKPTNLFLSSKKEVLAGVPVTSKITDGQFRMIFEDKLDAFEAFKKLCRVPTHDELPAAQKL